MPTTTDVPRREAELDWAAFRARRFPGSRRHDLEAIAAYGAYRHGDPVTEGAADAEVERATEAWEGEGGTAT